MTLDNRAGIMTDSRRPWNQAARGNKVVLRMVV